MFRRKFKAEMQPVLPASFFCHFSQAQQWLGIEECVALELKCQEDPNLIKVEHIHLKYNHETSFSL